MCWSERLRHHFLRYQSLIAFEVITLLLSKPFSDSSRTSWSRPRSPATNPLQTSSKRSKEEMVVKPLPSLAYVAGAPTKGLKKLCVLTSRLLPAEVEGVFALSNGREAMEAPQPMRPQPSSATQDSAFFTAYANKPMETAESVPSMVLDIFSQIRSNEPEHECFLSSVRGYTFVESLLEGKEIHAAAKSEQVSNPFVPK